MADTNLAATVGPDGRAVITITADGRQTWNVQQVSPEMPGAPGGATGQLRKNGSLVAPFEPGADAIGGEPYVRLRLGDTLSVEWSGCTPGAVGRALVIYEVEA